MRSHKRFKKQNTKNKTHSCLYVLNDIKTKKEGQTDRQTFRQIIYELYIHKDGYVKDGQTDRQ